MLSPRTCERFGKLLRFCLTPGVWSGAGDRLDVDFLALLADRAAAARVVGAAPQRPSVEPILPKRSSRTQSDLAPRHRDEWL
jgi:hypothetical protein